MTGGQVLRFLQRDSGFKLRIQELTALRLGVLLMSQFDLQITPDSPVRGEISVPGDKSISHRALMLSAIAEGESILCNPLMGADNQASLIALQQVRCID